MSSLSVGKNRRFSQEEITEETDPGKLYDFGYHLLQSKQYTAAYEIFSKIVKQQQNTGAFFNLAVCCMEANEYQKALQHLDNAFIMLKNAGLVSKNKLPDTISQKLIEKQRQTDDYRSPMEKEFSVYFPELSEERLWRLKIDIFEALQLWPQVLEFGQTWANKNCKNVINAIAKAKQS